MENNEFSVPPISGDEQAPFKEMMAEQPEPKTEISATPPPAKKSKWLLFGLMGALVVIVVLVVVLAMVFLRPQEEAPVPSPSPSPSPVLEATGSGLPKNIGERRDTLEKQLKNLDLQETDLSFPIIDFEIEF